MGSPRLPPVAVPRAYPTPYLSSLLGRSPIMREWFGDLVSAFQEELERRTPRFAIRLREYFDPDEGQSPDIFLRIVLPRATFEERLHTLEELQRPYRACIDRLKARAKSPAERRLIRNLDSSTFIEVESKG